MPIGWDMLIREEWVVSGEGKVIVTVPGKEAMRVCGKMAEMLQTNGHRVQKGVV